MARHIVDLLKEGVRDIGRQNLFEIELSRPGNAIENTLTITQNLVKSIVIPQTSIGEIVIWRMGRKVVIPGSIEFQDIVSTFHNDIEGKVRTFILNWQKEYYGNLGGGKFNRDIKFFIGGNVSVFQLDGNHTRVAKTIMRNAYPKVLGEMEYGHDNEDTLSSFNVIWSHSFSQYSNKASGFADIEVL